MTLDLRELFTAEKTLPVSASFDLSDFETAGVYPITGPVEFDGSVQSRAGIITLKGRLRFCYTAPCDRCAEQCTTPFDIAVEHIIVNEISNEQTDDFVLVDNMQLPLDELLRSDIILELPYKHLCSPDCKGVCPGCGVLLNTGECICKKEIDPRFAALDEFFE